MPETCMRFGEFGARVMIENKEVQHYAMHFDPAKKEVSCWIASEEGKAFSVVWLEPERDIEYPSGGMLYLDGHYARLVFRRSEKPIIFRHLVSESSYVPFLFSPLAVTDDDTYLDTSSHSIGEIKLVIVRTTIPEVVAEERGIHRGPPPLQKVHERSKKAIAHRVNYGSEIARPQMTSYHAKPVERIVTFIFRYRPLEMLRANDIVPRNPELFESQEHALDTPPTSGISAGKGGKFKVKKEAESGSDTDDDNSIREKALLAELEKIRKGRQVNSERPKKKVEEGRQASLYARRNYRSNMIIHAVSSTLLSPCYSFFLPSCCHVFLCALKWIHTICCILYSAVVVL